MLVRRQSVVEVLDQHYAVLEERLSKVEVDLQLVCQKAKFVIRRLVAGPVRCVLTYIDAAAICNQGV